MCSETAIFNFAAIQDSAGIPYLPHWYASRHEHRSGLISSPRGHFLSGVPFIIGISRLAAFSRQGPLLVRGALG
jgi:hypothetical protein